MQYNPTLVVADVNLNICINFRALYNLIPIDPIDISMCRFKYKKVDRCATPEGSVIYAGHSIYKKGIPNSLTTTRNFNNATCISLSLGNARYASLAISTNKVHICGCKNEEEIMKCIEYLYKRLIVMQSILDDMKSVKQDIIYYITNNTYNAYDFYSKFGNIVYIVDGYMSTSTSITEAIDFITSHCDVDIITEIHQPYIKNIDYHNIHYDMNVGFNLDLAALAYVASREGYKVDYSNINLSHVNITIPYDDTDNNTRRKKSRFVINVYRTGAVKCFGPTFNGILYNYAKFSDMIENNKDLLMPVINN